MLLKHEYSSRTSKSTINILSGVVSQIIILVLNFVIRYLFVQKVGYEYLGINSLFSGILTILSVADLGFGSALGIVLYASLAKKKEEEIAGLMNFFKKVYLIIGSIVTVVGLALTPFVKYLVNTPTEIPHLSVYFLFFILNTVSSYFISYRAILIRADQKNSIVNDVTTLVKICKAVLEALVLFICPQFFGLMTTYILYLVVMVLATYAIGLITSIKAKKMYPYAFENNVAVSPEKKGEIISTTKDLFIYRLCNALQTPIDSVLVSLFVGTVVLGVYSNYLLIFTTLMEFICLISRNVISSVGNFVVEKPIEQQKKLYLEIQVVYFAIIIFAVINFVSLATPFIGTVFKEGSTLSMWVVFLFGATLICRCSTELAIIFRETTKIYKKTRFISLFNTAIHIGLSTLLGYFYGLEGIMLGNVIAYFTTNFWFEMYALFKWHFNENPLPNFLRFLYVIALTSGISVGMYYLTSYLMSFGNISFFFVSILCSGFVSSISVLLLFPFNGFKQLFNRVKRILFAIVAKLKVFYQNRKVQLGILLSYVVVLSTLIVIRDVFAIQINKFVFFGVIVLFTLLSNKSNAIYILLFTLPIAPSLAELYILAFAALYFSIICFKDHSLKGWITISVFPVLILVMELVLSSIYNTTQYRLAFRIFVLLFILSFVFYDKSVFTKKHIYACLFGFVYLLIFIGINWIIPALYGLSYKGEKWLTLDVMLREVRLGFDMKDWLINHASTSYPFDRKEFINENPNNIGLISIVIITLCFALFGTEKRRKKILLLVIGIISFVFGLWCQSRTFLLIFVVLLLLMVFAPMIAKRSGLIKTLIILSTISLTFFIFVLADPTLFKKIIARFSDQDATTGGGRLNLIPQYFGVMFSNWKYAIFGVGCSNITTVYNIDIVPHANFLQFMVSYGLFGFVIFTAIFVYSIIRTKKLRFRSADIYLVFPIIFTSLFTLTLQLFLPSIILITFIPGVLCFSFLNKNKNENKEIKYYACLPSKVNKGKTLKLAMCSTSFGGGIKSYIANISPYLEKNNISIGYIFNPDTTEAEINSYSSIKKTSYLFKKKKTIKPLFLIKKLKYYIESFDDYSPDIIYINTSSYIRCALIMIAAVMHKTSFVILHCHKAVGKDDKLSLFERIFRWCFEFATYDRYACSMESGLVFFGKDFMNGKNKEYDALVNNFVDTELFKFNMAKRDAIRKMYRLKNSDVLIGTTGRLSDQKNQSFLIDLITTLPDKYKLIILGEGPLKSQLIGKADRLGVSKRVFIPGNKKEVDAYYSAFDIFCLPSLSEGLPFSSVEAQCSGLINILSSNIPHSTKLTEKVVFLPLDIDIWSSYILNLDLKNKNEREKGSELIEKANYSTNTAPKIIVDKITSVAYE